MYCCGLHLLLLTSPMAPHHAPSCPLAPHHLWSYQTDCPSHVITLLSHCPHGTLVPFDQLLWFPIMLQPCHNLSPPNSCSGVCVPFLPFHTCQIPPSSALPIPSPPARHSACNKFLSSLAVSWLTCFLSIHLDASLTVPCTSPGQKLICAA